MKKNYSYYSLLMALPVALILLVGFTGGQGGNFSGSPGDNGSTCTACHAPGANHGGTVTLTGVPSDYTAGTTYSLTLSISGSSVSKFGFNITAEDQNDTKVGTWTAGTGSQLRNGGAGNGLTHNASGSSSSSWTFSWTAPATDQGPVTFHYATIQANSASGNSGDQMISGSSQQVLSNGDISNTTFKLFPTVVQDELNVNLTTQNAGVATIYDMNGAMVSSMELTQENKLNLNDLTAGIYLLNVSVDGKTQTERFIKR